MHRCSDCQARHLLRRTGLRADAEGRPERRRRARAATRPTSLLDFRAKPFKPGGKDFERMHNKWVKFILKTKTPLQEKLVLFWHDHFADRLHEGRRTPS